MTTQFGDKYRRWAKITKATMRIQHKPGDAVQVDWAGTTIPYFDSVTNEESAAYLFIAVLPCSCYAYVEACDDMKNENWLLCHVHAYEYFEYRILVQPSKAFFGCLFSFDSQDIKLIAPQRLVDKYKEFLRTG